MFCQKCGAQLPEDSQFCFSCGERLVNSAADQPQSQTVQIQPQPNPAKNLSDEPVSSVASNQSTKSRIQPDYLTPDTVERETLDKVESLDSGKQAMDLKPDETENRLTLLGLSRPIQVFIKTAVGDGILEAKEIDLLRRKAVEFGDDPDIVEMAAKTEVTEWRKAVEFTDSPKVLVNSAQRPISQHETIQTQPQPQTVQFQPENETVIAETSGQQFGTSGKDPKKYINVFGKRLPKKLTNIITIIVVIIMGIISIIPKEIEGIKQASALSNPSVAAETYTIIEFSPIVEFHGEAFPVKMLATASMQTSLSGNPRMSKEGDYIGDLLGDFGVSLHIKSSTNEPIPIRVEVESDRFMRRSSEETLIPSDQDIEIFPRIAYDYSALEQLTQPSSENVFFRIYIDNTLKQEKTEVVRFHSVNEVPFLARSRWDNEHIIDRTWLFAAYVNEDDPLIDTILKEALEISTVEKIGFGNYSSFGGYQDLDDDGDTGFEVMLQVLAVWSVFQRHNIKYSNITTTSTGNRDLATQYVRTLQESFGNSQANCVDGTVLFASVLRKIGIEPFLVLIPGHMFLGYDLNEKGDEFTFLETTMLGSVDLSKHTKDTGWLGRLKNWSGLGKTQSSVSRDSFFEATKAGESRWKEVRDKIFDEAEEDYQIIFISECRSAGIMPIKRH